jgi:lantibiotic modifying enzyme
MSSPQPTEAWPQAVNAAFERAADRIGARLSRDAVWDGVRCNWLGDSLEAVLYQWRPVHRSFGPDLYAGTSGIALFLARLYQRTGESVFRATAAGGLEQAASRAAGIPPQARHGMYSGWGGIARAFIDCGEIFGDDRWRAQGLDMLAEAAHQEPGEYALDVLSGVAGLIPFLVRTASQRAGLLEAAVRLGDWLADRANRSDAGCSWTTVSPAEAPAQRDLTGYSHGAAGIATALLELWKATGEARFRSAAEDGFRYEQSWFSPQHQNWPDFRDHSGMASPTAGAPQQPAFMLAWCHGAPGIALSRLRAWQLTGDNAWREQAEVALASTWRSLQMGGPGQENFSLCHGSAGNADILLTAAQVLGNDSWRQAAQQVGLRGAEIYDKSDVPWPSGLMTGGENPTLLLGSAGTGYFYLRLSDPSIPSVLTI